MKKTRLFAFALAVVMMFSILSVSAFAAYTPWTISDRSTKLAAAGATDLYYNEITKASFEEKTSANGAWYGYTRAGGWTWVDYRSAGSLFNGESVYDSWGKKEGDNYNGKNISTDGNGIIFSEWYSDYSATDDYQNYLSLQMKSVEDHRGKDFVLSTGVTMLSDSFVANFVYQLDTIDNSNLVLTPFTLTNGMIKVGETDVAALVKGVTANITLHVKIVAPTESGAYNEDDFTNLSLADFEKKYGTVRFDLYVDGVKVVADALLVSQAEQKNIKKSGTATGLSTDFRLLNVCCGKVTGKWIFGSATPNVRDGEQVLRMEYVDLYMSKTVINLYNNANTVNGYDLTINNGVLGLNYYLNLQSDVLADENAKVVFTTPRGEVQEKLVKDVAAETNGSYKFTANVSSVEMASDITMEIKSGETVYNIYKNGAKATEHTYSVKAYAEQLLSDATYGKIAKAMLNYGAYAQEYFKFDTENLANANCGYTTELSAVNNDVSNVSITGDAPAGTKAALVLDSNTSIVIYDKDGNKIGEKKGINSLQLDTEYTIELTGGTSVTVSVLAIGEKVLESNATSQSYKDLIKALKLFSDASKELNP